MATSAIPTTGINGIRFRSRIEAQWAEMFTKLGWEWEYEPIDLKGYIPDFILKFPHKHVLVEVKGDTDIKNIEQYADKIVKSGWIGEYLLVCSVLPDYCEDAWGKKSNYYSDYHLCIGLLGYSGPAIHISWVEYLSINLPIVNGNRYFGHFSLCSDCNKITITENNSSGADWIWCRNCSSSDKSLMLCDNEKKKKLYNKINQFWYEAKNNVQWKKS
jgi:hypothetical protein